VLSFLTSRIIYKIGIMAAIIIAFSISSFATLAYFQSEQTLLGNSINIAGKNRFLTMNLLYQTSEYLNEISSFSSSSSSAKSVSRVNDAINNLNSNIMVLRQGGIISGIELKPLPSKFLDSWKRIDRDWNRYKSFIIDSGIRPNNIMFKQQHSLKTDGISATSAAASNVSGAPRTTLYESTRAQMESLTTSLISSSDILVTELGVDSAKNSMNAVLLENLFGIMNMAVVLLIVYLVIKTLKPIGALTHATYEIKKGNLDISIQKYKGNDELATLSESFYSMVKSIKNHITKQNQLTSELRRLNEQLEQKDKLKDEFINIAAHELKAPIQPILGLSEILNSRISRSKSSSSNIGKAKLNESDEQFVDTILRNAKRLQALSENILDITKIESRTLKLNKEKFNINEKIRNVISDIKSKWEEDDGAEVIFDDQMVDPIVVEADALRINQVITNLLTNAVKFTKKRKHFNGQDNNIADYSAQDEGSTTIQVSATIKQPKNTHDKDFKNNSINDQCGEVIISVKDRGTGIDPDIKDKLFSKFATKSDTGSGLGLYISKNIVEAHGGKIWAENNTGGKGATFSFSLPLPWPI
jgi:signal transduction histidine kinase